MFPILGPILALKTERMLKRYLDQAGQNRHAGQLS